MWLHFNKFDEFTGYSLPVWAFAPLMVIFLLLVFIAWPITAIAMSLYCFNMGKRIYGWLFLVTIPIWLFKVLG